MNVQIIHQLWEGNQSAEFLAKLGESGKNDFYEDVQGLSKLVKGILPTDKLGLLAIRW